MILYNYIDVALLSQNGREVATDFTYTSSSLPDAASWASGQGLPGSVLDYFLNAREAFLQWTTREGNFFALIFRNPFSNREGYHMLAMKVNAGFGLTGRQVVRSLMALRKKLVEENHRSEESVNEVFASCDVPRDGRSYDSWRIAPTFVERTGAAPCYRTYVSMIELENFITFPHQPEYDNYGSVIYVAATTSLRPGVELHHVVAPIKNIYTILCHEGVESSRPAASAGDRIMLSYSKPGYSIIRQAVIVGRQSSLVVYDGATMVVKSAAEAHLTFVRRIPLNVRSAKGGVVTGYTVSVNGRPVNTMEPYLEITEAEVNSSVPLTIRVSSTNFEVLKIERSAVELNPTIPLDIVLKPIEQGITLRLDFGEGRVFEQQISIEKNTPEYSQLHSGSFHGFRAHRMNIAGSGETYNVDVRAAAKPIAPTFANMAPKPAAPRIERQTETRPEPVAAPDLRAPEVEIATASPSATANDDTTPRHSRRGVIGGLIAILIVGLGAAAWFMRDMWMPEAATPDLPVATAEVPAENAAEPAVVPETSVNAENQAASGAAALVAPVADMTGNEDDAYLNKSSQWVRDSLKTESGRALYDDITAGRIAEAAANPYFATPGRATNSEAIKMIDILWKSVSTPTERSNRKCMTRYAGKPVNLRDLFEEAARYQPAEPNPLPRPGK